MPRDRIEEGKEEAKSLMQANIDGVGMSAFKPPDTSLDIRSRMPDFTLQKDDFYPNCCILVLCQYTRRGIYRLNVVLYPGSRKAAEIHVHN
jgi:hypothetical protein